MLKEKKKHAAFDVLHFGMHQVLYLYSIWTIHVFVHIWYVHAIKKNILKNRANQFSFKVLPFFFNINQMHSLQERIVN